VQDDLRPTIANDGKGDTKPLHSTVDRRAVNAEGEREARGIPPTILEEFYHPLSLHAVKR
jgi:hypothetical protein